MTSPLPRRVAACLATGLLATFLTVAALPAGPPAASASEHDGTPLAVSITTLSPSVIPARGPITVTGEITNVSDARWTDLKVYLLTSVEPIIDQESLAEASATDPAAEIGPRLTDPGLYADVGDLAPGSSTSYTLSVPRSALRLSGAPGVYWLGVHVLGTSTDGRLLGADGRARTFVPLLPPRAPKTSLALVVPIAARVLREEDGRLADPERWHELLSPEGRLGRLLEFSGTTFGFPLTWVVDPAVLDAARSTALDNPPTYIGPTDGTDPSTPPLASPSTSPSGSPTAESEESEEAESLSPEAEVAESWLRTFTRQADQHTVMTVPYADVDVAALLRHDYLSVYQEAAELSSATMESLEVLSRPIVAPPDGLFPPPLLRDLDAETPLLLSDRAAPTADGPVVEAENGRRIVLVDSAASSGGPGPTPAHSTLATRQRILSEAALHALSENRDRPLIVSMPQSWDPGSSWRIAQFFSGLDVGWLRGTDIPGVLAQAELSPGADRPDDRLRYPRRQRRAELPVRNLSATEELAEAGDVLADLLSRNDTVDRFLAKAAMLGSSTHARRDPRTALALTREITARIRARMGRVRVDAPSFVTMSSETGALTVTLINELEEPVTVGITADVRGQGLRIRAADPVSLGPGNRATVRMRASSDNIGVYSVTLSPTTSSGATVGDSATFSVRSSQVGLVIWIVMGVGAAVLFGAATIRITRRIRGRRRTSDPVMGDSGR